MNHSTNFDIDLSISSEINGAINFKILIDDIEYVSSTMSIVGEIYNFKFDTLPLIRGPHRLKIVLLDTESKKDSVLNVDRIAVNNIELHSWLRWTLSLYIFDSPHIVDGVMSNTMDNCVNLGYPGYYQIEFSVPALLWTLKKVPPSPKNIAEHSIRRQKYTPVDKTDNFTGDTYQQAYNAQIRAQRQATSSNKNIGE
jgi:hypothetical protein